MACACLGIEREDVEVSIGGRIEKRRVEIEERKIKFEGKIKRIQHSKCCGNII